MVRVQKPARGRLVVSIIYNSMDALAEGLKLLERPFGQVQFETLDIPYSTEQYSEEMGNSLQRRFYSFERLVERDSLPNIKPNCRKIEKRFGDIVHDYAFRTINIDPGILTPDNLIMASHRDYNHRVYLGGCVFGELALVYSKSRFVKLPWTNMDFCQGEAIEFFLRVRDTLESIAEPATTETG